MSVCENLDRNSPRDQDSTIFLTAFVVTAQCSYPFLANGKAEWERVFFSKGRINPLAFNF